MARKAPEIGLSKDEHKALQDIVRKSTSEQRMVLRAKIILLAAKGCYNYEIMEKLGISKPVVIKWRSRFAQNRLDGLYDSPRSGKPRVYGPDVRIKIAAEACKPPRGQTHWSTRDLAKHIGKVHHTTVHRILKAENIKPHLYKMWKDSTDPDFEAKMMEVVGLYLDPPENAIVLSVDEKTAIQALGRPRPNKPVKPDHVEKINHEYIRHGTQSLIAALAVHEGTINGQCFDKHSHKEFLIFLKNIARYYPQGELHLIMDNLSMHKHKEVKKWLKCNERVKVHFTPTYASWLNQIELWFSILARKIIRRGVFSSKQELVTKIMEFIKRYNKDAKPFRWTYTGDPLII
jgi:transposase